jgi:hypothetical protein
MLYQINQKGMSLVSVMIAVGLLGGVSLALMRLSENSNQINNSAQMKTDEVELSHSLRMVLNNPAHCQASIMGETFKKENIDFGCDEITPATEFSNTDEGLDIELWYSKDGGTVRTIKKFNGFDNPATAPDPEKSIFGKLKLTSIKLVMNNGVAPCSSNYPNGVGLDTGQVVVLYEKKINKNLVRNHKKVIDVNVGFSTVGGVSTILSCSAMPMSTGSPRDSQSVSGNTINGLNSGSTYLVNIYGIVPDKGTGMGTLGSLRVRACSGSLLAETISQLINWPDGKIPQSGSLLITAPASGCIRTYVDSTVNASYTSVIEI